MRVNDRISEIFIAIKNGVLGNFNKCIVCRTMLEEKENFLCKTCANTLKKHQSNRCIICSRECTGGICSQCMSNPRPYDNGAIIYVYNYQISNMMHKFKEEGDWRIGKFFAYTMALDYEYLDWKDVDFVTSVPSSFIRSILRMQDPCARVTKKFAQYSQIDYVGTCLKRTRHDKPMRHASDIQRMKRAKINYALSSYSCKGKNIVLVDDVSTSGATLHVCAQLLKNNGANMVYVYSIAGRCAKRKA